MTGPSTDRDDVIRILRSELKRRSGKAWSVTGGKGTAWGWITITAPPCRRVGYGHMTDVDQTELAELLGLDRVHHQGESVPDSQAHRIEYVDRARGLGASPAAAYWD